MNTNIEKLLNEELKTEIEALKDLELGSDKHKTAAESICKLTDRKIELAKLEIETENKFKHMEKELELKFQQLEDERKDKRWKNGLTAAGIIIPAGLAVWGTVTSFKFERTDSVTTIMGRGWIQKLLPKK